ncbi:hypothetical protein PGT21_009629 [Puccinia graminis f. sp. tritici]|uniref:Uncharacterized protein n=1 Tax=Puccinia graminis f. sp. tritici TaxID=56615 RepID=A0A5B0MD19_PUCGR|nr:hypothetical protein PGTUg99_021633 [Puccinia graminis f. sp. tritici]KAA1090662.1 hypothetical protein PGT21_009629 [Puccinia graminis f. sp. tritici]
MGKQKENPQSNKIEAYLIAKLFFKENNLDHKTTPLKLEMSLDIQANQTAYPALEIIA